MQLDTALIDSNKTTRSSISTSDLQLAIDTRSVAVHTANDGTYTLSAKSLENPYATLTHTSGGVYPSSINEVKRVLFLRPMFYSST